MKSVASAFALVAGLVVAGVAFGGRTTGTFVLTSTMNAGQVVPRSNSGFSVGRGTLKATLLDRPVRSHLSWTLRISGVTSRAIHSYIYLGKPGQVGKVAVIVCSPCHSPAVGNAIIRSNVVKALEAGQAYIETATAKHPAGEIRGQIRVVRKQ